MRYSQHQQLLNSPSPWDQELPWCWGWTEAGTGDGPAGGPGSGDPWPHRAGLWGAADQPCCGVVGAGADGPWRADMGSWARWMLPQGARQGWQCVWSHDVQYTCQNLLSAGRWDNGTMVKIYILGISGWTLGKKC